MTELGFTEKYFPNRGGIYTLNSLSNSLVNDIFCFQKDFINLYYKGAFLVYVHWFWVPVSKLQTFSRIFWVLTIDYSLCEKAILGIFVSLFVYEVTTTIFVFKNGAVKAQHDLFANEPFLRKMLVSFFSLCYSSKHWRKSRGKLMQSSETYGSSHPEVFLEKRVLKICSKFTGEHPCRSVTGEHPHFGMGVLLYICCIFSEQLFLGTPLGGCFST